jgi:hypothetical protein
MKYFTPELYLKLSATGEPEADLVDEGWEQAIKQYRRYVKENRSQMPSNVRTLAEKCCFHDALLRGVHIHEPINSRKHTACRVLTIGLLLGDETVVLSYFSSGPQKETRRRKNWPYSSAQKHWLYDEVSIAENAASPGTIDGFIHRILWSDGSESEIPFAVVIIDRFPSLNHVSA